MINISSYHNTNHRRTNKRSRVMSDLAGFQTEILRSGVSPEGVTLCNCEVRDCGKYEETPCWCLTDFIRMKYG